VKLYSYICKKTNNEKIRVFSVIFLVLIGFGDNIIQLTTFYYLCHTQGGLRIYKTVENVEGYLDKNDSSGYINDFHLAESNYKFIEVEVEREQKEKDLFFEGEQQQVRLTNGKYRYYFVADGEPHCQYFHERKKNPKYSHYFKNFPEGYCMALKKIDSFRSLYAYQVYQINENLFPILRIRKATTQIWDIKTGEVLGSMTSFIYYGSWFFKAMHGLALIECPKCDPPSLHALLLHKVLKPINIKEGME
jgi:hypothetical protein